MSNHHSRRFGRRFFLRAAGVSVALPALSSLLPRGARAADGDVHKRFVGLFFPNGSTMRQDWQLSGSGSNYTMGTAHDALIPLQSKISMFQNLNGSYGGAPDHSRGTIEFLTGAPISNNTTPEVDISIDQAIADYLQPDTPIRSLHLGPTPYPGGPPSDTGWPSGYNTYISWSSMTSPNAPLESARVAFDQVYVPDGADPGLAEQRFKLRQSVLDHTVEQIDTISPRLGTDDRAKLDEYLTAVREVETKLQEDPPAAGCAGNPEIPADSLGFPEHTKAMLDVIKLAFMCDMTRIVTYSMDYGFGNKDFGFLGLGNRRHHNLSHSGTDPDTVNVHKAIVQWYMQQIAYFLGELDAVDESGATMLDNSIVYVGSDLGDAWAHSHQGLSNFVAGGGAGALNPGRLIDASGVPYDDVLLGLAHAMDAPLAGFSGSSTPFSGL
jgi:hypothetical protein